MGINFVAYILKVKPKNCGHEWKPIKGWSARYRCKFCKAIGYKARAATDNIVGNPGQIVTYICHKCRGPATLKKPGKNGICFDCMAHKIIKEKK